MILAVQIGLQQFSGGLLRSVKVLVLADILLRRLCSRMIFTCIIFDSSCFVVRILSLVKNAFVASQLFETHLSHGYVLESPDEELVLAALEEESEDHHDHTALSLHFFSNDLLFLLIEVLVRDLTHDAVVCTKFIVLRLLLETPHLV